MKLTHTMKHRFALTILTPVLTVLAAVTLSAYSAVVWSQTVAPGAVSTKEGASAITAVSDQTAEKRKRKAKAKARSKTSKKSFFKENINTGNPRLSGQGRSFAQADVDKTGKLTKKQAFNAKMYDVDRYFFDIDTDIDGYVSQTELRAWKANPVRTAPRPRGDRLDRFVAGDGARR